MSAPRRFSQADVVEAVRRSGGNIAQAADSLGIHPNNLRKRLGNVDIEAERERVRPVSVAGHHFEAARQAAFDLAYLERKNWRPEDVVRAFFNETFDDWIREKLATLQKAKP